MRTNGCIHLGVLLTGVLTVMEVHEVTAVFSVYDRVSATLAEL
jgi:hypothetical protein